MLYYLVFKFVITFLLSYLSTYCRLVNSKNATFHHITLSINLALTNPVVIENISSSWDHNFLISILKDVLSTLLTDVFSNTQWFLQLELISPPAWSKSWIAYFRGYYCNSLLLTLWLSWELFHHSLRLACSRAIEAFSPLPVVFKCALYWNLQLLFSCTHQERLSIWLLLLSL